MIVSSFFFFKQKTAYEMRISDWSSDVCSSDLSATRRNAASVWTRRKRLFRKKPWSGTACFRPRPESPPDSPSRTRYKTIKYAVQLYLAPGRLLLIFLMPHTPHSPAIGFAPEARRPARHRFPQQCRDHRSDRDQPAPPGVRHDGHLVTQKATR